VKKLFLLILISIFFLPSCSVYMAAKKEGVNIEELAQCKNRICLLSKGATPFASEEDEGGILLSEDLLVQRPTGSTGRAVMHGVLDVFTLGLWEVAGTPIEWAKGSKM
jgi:hypothetical protein